ncbi:MAG: YeiH family protein [Vicinamibacterales bacterium]
MADTAAGEPSSRWWAHEDWLAVFAGVFLLAAIAADALPALPALKWGGAIAWTAPWAPAVVTPWLLAGALAWLLTVLVTRWQGGPVRAVAGGFVIVAVLAWLSILLAGHTAAAAWGLEYVIFALVIGLAVGHTVGTPPWLLAAARTEFFIKTGLVVMGATILFAEILQAGALGLLQAVVVVIVVWRVAFWLTRRFRVDDEFGVMLATAVSICGVSAAIAACGAIRGDRRKLSYVTSVVLIVALPMIVLLPWLVRAAAIPDVVAGAWMGGTLDTTGSVVAAGALVSETTVKVGTIVKFSQNVLIGVAAFAISLWWALRQRGDQAAPGNPLLVIWERFPKFVLGFVAASLVFSFVVPASLVAGTKAAVTSIRTLWFALAFVSIGLETRLVDLFTLEGGRPLFSFVLAQAFNVVWTLVVAWLIFGGVLFTPPAF